MNKEIIYDPDARWGIRAWESRAPRFSHFEVEHGSSLRSSKNSIINNLIDSGLEVHETETTFYMGFPSYSFELTGHFVSQVRREFQIRLGDDGWLRFRFERPSETYLTLFYINYEQQGKGKGRVLFPQVIDALFKAGTFSVRGEVATDPAALVSNPDLPMPTPISRLRDYRDKLAPGTVLGLSYVVDDPAYLTRRALPIQQLTVHSIQDDVVHFQKQDGHHLHYGLDQPITYLRFGSAPYDQAENILSVPQADDHNDASGPGTALRNDVAAAVSQVLDKHTQAIDKHFAQRQNILAFWVVEGVLDAIRKHRASPANKP